MSGTSDRRGCHMLGLVVLYRPAQPTSSHLFEASVLALHQGLRPVRHGTAALPWRTAAGRLPVPPQVCPAPAAAACETALKAQMAGRSITSPHRRTMMPASSTASLSGAVSHACRNPNAPSPAARAHWPTSSVPRPCQVWRRQPASRRWIASMRACRCEGGCFWGGWHWTLALKWL